MRIQLRNYTPTFSKKLNKWKIRGETFNTLEEADVYLKENKLGKYNGQTEKTCTHCKNTLALDKFGNDRDNKINGKQAYCVTCVKEINTERAKQKKQNKICLRCSEKSLENNNHCINHWFIYKSLDTFGTTKYSKELKDIAEKQNWICPYTGDTLIPSINMSVDHIISKKEDPSKTYDINNIQWVTFQANLCKSSLSHDAFILFCKKVLERFS